MSSNAAASSLAVDTINNLPPDNVVFGSSPAMQAVRQKIERVAGASIPVLIQGESGTGKEIAAKLIHNWSPWKEGPFVKVNCPAIPSTLLESELFGYEKGAFTGAYGTKPGRIEMAHRGTLFMDEISELAPTLQAKLLQLLQDGQFCRIGAQVDRRVEARIVCATNRRLDSEIEAGAFRRDLFYRINVVNLQLPALRERSEDIPLLIDYFLQYYIQKYNTQAIPLSLQLVRRLQSHSWPGNIRELENLIKRYVVLRSEDAIASELVPRTHDCFDPEIPSEGNISLKTLTRQAVQKLERKVMQKVLQAHRWNRKQAARALGISYRAMLYKMKQAGLPSKKVFAAKATVEIASSDD